MQHEALALDIVEAVVQACAPLNVPVTLKMRTGWCQAHKNALALALGAEARGVAMVTVHGRTREQGYGGQAEHATVAAVKRALQIPVVANGDIDSPEAARRVLAATGVDALMIGRAAQGRPWIFGDIAHFLAHGQHRPPPHTLEARDVFVEHLADHYRLYGELAGTRSARKHIGWALKGLPGGEAFRAEMNALDTSAEQVERLSAWFERLAGTHERLPLAYPEQEDPLPLAA
jgi:tRNA-dihydrouridine synthase B